MVNHILKATEYFENIIIVSDLVSDYDVAVQYICPYAIDSEIKRYITVIKSNIVVSSLDQFSVYFLTSSTRAW